MTLESKAESQFSHDIGRARYSIIVEWENVLLAGADRSRRVIEALIAQVDRLQRSEDSRDGSSAVEILVVHCESDAPAADLEENFVRWVGPDWRELIRLITSASSDYYEIKNVGVTHATGDIVIFLDSDVIPDPDWLHHVAHAFEDDSVRVLAGSAYLETRSWTEKAFALSWYFPLRSACSLSSSTPSSSSAWLGLAETNKFFANNVAFRAEIIRRHPFPQLEGTSRGACQSLAAELGHAGIPIHESPKAAVTHPAPRGVLRIAERGMAEGRDRLMARQMSPSANARLRKSTHRALKETYRSAKRAVREHDRVGLPAYQLPAVLVFTTAYHGSVLLGDLMTRVFPRSMKARFRI